MSGEVEVKRSICYCPTHCRVNVEVKDGELIGVQYKKAKDSAAADRWLSTVGGCPRSVAWKEWHEHPLRLNFPLKRAGARGENKWQQITWDQAYDEIAEKMEKIRKEFGPEALAIGETGEHTQTYRWSARARFAYLFGTPNYVSHIQVCFSHVLMMSSALTGWGCYFPYVRSSTKCFILWGINPGNSYRYVWHAVRDGQKNHGMKLIVVDPRVSEAAKAADLHLQLRPGTDPALTMGLINVMITENLYDKDFVEKWTYGFDKLVERAKEFPPEKVAEITGVPAEKIREAARMYAANKPGIIMTGMGVEQLSTGIKFFHNRFTLAALAGNYDVPGGEYLQAPHFGIRPAAELECIESLSPEQKKKMIGSDRFRLFSWDAYDLIWQGSKKVRGIQIPTSVFACSAHAPSVYRAILTEKPYPVKGMFNLCINPLGCHSNTNLIYAALKKLDLHVVADVIMNPLCQLADYVLPAASWLEKPYLMGGDHDMAVQVGAQALPAFKEGKYDRRDEYDMYRELGLRLGQKGYWPWKDIMEFYNYALEPMGMTFDSLYESGGYTGLEQESKKYERRGFGTFTGKFEIYSTVLEKLGYDPLPGYVEPAQSYVSTPEYAKEYPLILETGARSLRYYHTQWYHIDSFRTKEKFPQIQIHPDKAAELGIAEGDEVWVETKLGRVTAFARLFKGLLPNCVNVRHYGPWNPDEPGEDPHLHGMFNNINVVIDDDPDLCDPEGGGWPLRELLCKVYKKVA